MEIDFLDGIDTKPDYSWLDSPSNRPNPISLPSQPIANNN
jgi:hypothetical protein